MNSICERERWGGVGGGSSIVPKHDRDAAERRGEYKACTHTYIHIHISGLMFGVVLKTGELLEGPAGGHTQGGSFIFPLLFCSSSIIYREDFHESTQSTTIKRKRVRHYIDVYVYVYNGQIYIYVYVCINVGGMEVDGEKKRWRIRVKGLRGNAGIYVGPEMRRNTRKKKN